MDYNPQIPREHNKYHGYTGIGVHPIVPYTSVVYLKGYNEWLTLVIFALRGKSLQNNPFQNTD